MIYRCTKCLNLSTRPNSHFKKGDQCDPCLFLDTKETNISQEIDNFWAHIKKLYPHRDPLSLNYVLGVSGGKDSLRQALFARNFLGISPTLVSVALPPSQSSLAGVKNIQNLYDSGFSVQLCYPAVETLKRLTKFCFFELSNLKVASEVALFNGAARMADLMQADVVLWGENPAYSVGDTGSASSTYFDGSSIYQINTLQKAIQLPSDIIQTHQFFYDIKVGLKKIASKIVFMGSVMPSWSNMTNGIVSLMHGFTPRDNMLPSDILNISAVDEDFVLINQYIKYLKFGFGRTTDILNELIREGSLSRQDAFLMLNEYEPYVPTQSVSRFSRFIQVKESKVWEKILSFANPVLFNIEGSVPIPTTALLSAR